MRRDRLRLAGTLEHEQLREDGDRLDEDGEGPHDFGEAEVVVEDERQQHARPEQVLDAECVNGRVVRRSAG